MGKSLHCRHTEVLYLEAGKVGEKYNSGRSRRSDLDCRVSIAGLLGANLGLSWLISTELSTHYQVIFLFFSTVDVVSNF